MITDEQVVSALLVAGIEDWIALDDVTWEAMKGNASDENKGRTIRVLEQLFRAGLTVPGDLGESGFEDWVGSPDEWLGRACAELKRLGWSPMGAGFWLRITSLGEQAAREAGPR